VPKLVEFARQVTDLVETREPIDTTSVESGFGVKARHMALPGFLQQGRRLQR
jgi:hypothetical protein